MHMHHIRQIIALLALSVAGMATAQPLDTLTVRIKGMRCDECAHKVMTRVLENEGVADIWFNIERRTATVSYDPHKTTPEAIQQPLRGTRYNPTPYSTADTIRRGYGQRMPELLSEADAERAMAALRGKVGIDSLAPRLDKHYLFIRYDANRTSKDDIRRELVAAGFTPSNYYTGPKVAYADFAIAPDRARTIDTDALLALAGVDDACLNVAKGTLAITYYTDETTRAQLSEAVSAMGFAPVR